MIYEEDYGITDLGEVARMGAEALRPYLGEFDSIVACGWSGLIVAGPVAVLLGKPLVIVRKADDSGADGEFVENQQAMGKRVLFVDDVVSSGRTRRWVRKHVLENGA